MEMATYSNDPKKDNPKVYMSFRSIEVFLVVAALDHSANLESGADSSDFQYFR